MTAPDRRLSATRSSLAPGPQTPAVVLAVAGTDSGGAAGLAADLTTIASLGAHGACVVAAVTAQDTTGVHAVHSIPLDVVGAQIDAVLHDLPVAAVKTGMLGSAEVVRLVADRLGASPEFRSGGRPLLVVDPVLVATSGAVLGDDAVRTAYVEHLLPVATVVTPNRSEALALLGLDHDDTTPSSELASRLAAFGCAVVLTGGPDGVVSPGSTTAGAGECTDWLALPPDIGGSQSPGASDPPMMLRHAAVDTDNDHGTGCTHSSALAAHLARGLDLPTAARAASAYTTRQLVTSSAWRLGRGRGPVAHTAPRPTLPSDNKELPA